MIGAAAVVALGACGGEAAFSSDPPTGEAESALTCVTIQNTGPFTTSTDDAAISTDFTDPTKANTNYGSVAMMTTGFVGTEYRRILMKFDLAGAGIAVGSPVESASLRLRLSQSLGKNPVDFYAASAPWSEASVTWNTMQLAPNGGLGALAATLVTLGVPNTSGVDVPLPAALVESWENPGENYGLIFDHPAGGRTSFGSSEAGLASRPSLRLCYEPANCGDGIQNQGEGGIDCGGPCATLCCSQLPELCNGLDDNCNGQIDDGNPGGGVACSTDLPGACTAGTTVCTAGGLACVPVQSDVERCDGVDNDCNGLVDDNCSIFASDFVYSVSGAIPGMTCINLREDGDSAAWAWADNYLCWTHGYNLLYSVGGPVVGQKCVNIQEPGDASNAAWQDNYICSPYPLPAQWSVAGPIDTPEGCVNIYEPGDPQSGAWSDNYLCFGQYECDPSGIERCDGVDNDCDGQVDNGCIISGNDFAYSVAGPIAGMTCINIYEAGDSASGAWSDNYLCWNYGYDLHYSVAGRLPGQHCVNIQEPGDASNSAWVDNYICSPYPFPAAWSVAGPCGAPGGAVNIHEPGDPQEWAWQDNYLCFYQDACVPTPSGIERCDGIDDDCDGLIDNNCVIYATDFNYSIHGAIPGMSCVNIYEPGDSDALAWEDNYLCWSVDAGYAFSYSISQTLPGQNCINIQEPGDATNGFWVDNYLCSPYPLPAVWRVAGPIATSGGCVGVNEPGDPEHVAWEDNYLCFGHE